MSTKPTILVVDDEPSMRTYMNTLLEGYPCHVELADSGTDAVSRIERGLAPDLVLLDVNMPGLDGIDTLAQIRRIASHLCIVMVSCITDSRKIVRAMQLGAQDYLTKPVTWEQLEDVLNHIVKPAERTVVENSSEISRLTDDMLFVCASAAMRKVRSQATLIANSEIPVLLLGESGTGKEVIATLVHQMSPRADRTFLKVNCAAVPGELLESELFGYEVGAFTGAVKAKPGKFELCNRGTIFLDEIGEMPPALQAKLLHVLQDHEFSRLGGRSTTKVDVRVISATNINVQEAIANKKLRADLYYRLNGLALRLPPLRERREEIPVLFRHFITAAADKFVRSVPPISERLMQACLFYPWPGNVRELQNFVKRYMVLGDEELAISELTGGGEMGIGISGDPSSSIKKLKSIVRNVKNGAEAIAITEALQQTNWKRKQAAALLGISYKALLYKMRDLEITPPPPGDPLHSPRA